MNKFDNKFCILSLLILLILGVFLSGCVERGAQGLPAQQKITRGLVIGRVLYNSEVAENSEVKIDVELENRGYEAKNVKLTLVGLTNRWNPAPPISKEIGTIETDKKLNVSFLVKSPEIEENRTDVFGFKMEYDYTSKYEAKFIIKKDDKGNISLELESERMLRESPITLKYSGFSYFKIRVDADISDLKKFFDISIFDEDLVRKILDLFKEAAKKLFETIKKETGMSLIIVNFTVSNVGGGEIDEIHIPKEFELSLNRFFCVRSVDLKKTSTLTCGFLVLWQPEEIEIREIPITLLYRYKYSTNLNYKIKVYNVK